MCEMEFLVVIQSKYNFSLSPNKIALVAVSAADVHTVTPKHRDLMRGVDV